MNVDKFYLIAIIGLLPQTASAPAAISSQLPAFSVWGDKSCRGKLEI